MDDDELQPEIADLDDAVNASADDIVFMSTHDKHEAGGENIK